MSIGFPPKYKNRIDLNLPLKDTIQLVKETLMFLDWNYWLDEPSVFNAWGKPNSNFDRGPHRITVKVDEYDGVDVTSRSLLPFPFFDFGTNKEMVEAFIESFSLKSLDRPQRFSETLPNGGRVANTVIEMEK